MIKQRKSEKIIQIADAFDADLRPATPIDANRAETAEYLAQMSAELITLASTARLSRLSMLLDFVRREAEAEAAAC